MFEHTSNVVCFICRTLRLTTAGYRRWGSTARRADASTSGCQNWSCRNAEESGSQTQQQIEGFFLGSSTDDLKNLLQLMQGWPGVDGLSRQMASRSHGLPFRDKWTQLRRGLFFSNICCLRKIQTDHMTGHMFSILRFYFELPLATQQCSWGATITKRSKTSWKHKIPQPSWSGNPLQTGQECCNGETVPNIPVYYYSLERCVCLWMCGMQVQFSRLSLEKTGRAARVCVCVCLLEMSNFGGIVSMGTEMEMMSSVSHTGFFLRRCRSKKLQMGSRGWFILNCYLIC